MRETPSWMGGQSDDLINIGRGIIEAINDLRTLIMGLFGTVQRTGLFTMTAVNTRVVLDPNVTAASIITLQAVNALAATDQAGATALYVDRAASVAGTSFTVKTANTSNATNGAQYSYVITNSLV